MKTIQNWEQFNETMSLGPRDEKIYPVLYTEKDMQSCWLANNYDLVKFEKWLKNYKENYKTPKEDNFRNTAAKVM